MFSPSATVSLKPASLYPEERAGYTGPSFSFIPRTIQQQQTTITIIKQKQIRQKSVASFHSVPQSKFRIRCNSITSHDRTYPLLLLLNTRHARTQYINTETTPTTTHILLNIARNALAPHSVVLSFQSRISLTGSHGRLFVFKLIPTWGVLAFVLEITSVHRRYLPTYKLSFILSICPWVFWSASVSSKEGFALAFLCLFCSFCA